MYIPVIYTVYLFHDCVVQDCWIFLFMYIIIKIIIKDEMKKTLEL